MMMGTFYFDEKVVDSLEYGGPLGTSSAVVLGLTAFASVTSENIDILLEDEHKKSYATGGKILVPIYVSGVMKVEKVVIAVLDSDLVTVDVQVPGACGLCSYGL